jgi:hypothetical protein
MSKNLSTSRPNGVDFSLVSEVNKICHNVFPEIVLGFGNSNYHD